MPSTTRAYHVAAIGYFLYGLIYLSGAIYLAQTGASPRAMGSGSIWWFILGAVMVVALPVLIWKEFKWVTRALAVLVFVRVIGLGQLFVSPEWDAVPLPWGGTISEAYGAAVFLGVAGFTCFLLTRAGWSRWLERQRTGGAASGGT